ncbi:hypothetical protein [Mangrovicella endophytica]|uniref:hypothetical protein n=1 Tax=Mangrovicella endophytica TaxID=2066697 RepID=UPI0012FFFA28|nr:hypothetical protein [Mangrovicella endophytica]
MRLNAYYAAVFLVSALPAGAVELHHIEVRRGTDGLDRVPVTITNAAGAPLACHIDLAHWYSAAPTPVAPGATASIELWRDPSTAAYSLLNDKRENMAVETLWCGFARDAYGTRSQIVLDRSAGPSSSRAVTCGEEAGRLRCR